MVFAALLLFLLVLLFSFIVYLFCKRVIYKLNKRVLARNIAILKNSKVLSSFEALSEDEIREKLIIPFFLVLGYNTFDMREFVRTQRRATVEPDYITKKWDNSKLCKRSLYIKYEKFNDDAVDLKNKVYIDNKMQGANIDELMNKLYFNGEYYILTNGYLYLFFNKNYVSGSKKFEFCFNVKSFTKSDIARLAYFTKQYMFLQISDVYRA